MSEDFLKERRNALEEEFFHRANQQKLSDMKEQLAEEKTRDGLARASGISDEAILSELLERGMSGETIAALSLVPSVHVAWADGKIQDGERDAILKFAETRKIASGSPAYEMLQYWLTNQPAPELFETWTHYIAALSNEVLSGQQLDSVRNQIVGFAKLVAESAGGFLGVGKVAGSEEAALEQVAKAFATSRE